MIRSWQCGEDVQAMHLSGPWVFHQAGHFLLKKQITSEEEQNLLSSCRYSQPINTAVMTLLSKSLSKITPFGISSTLVQTLAPFLLKL